MLLECFLGVNKYKDSWYSYLESRNETRYKERAIFVVNLFFQILLSEREKSPLFAASNTSAEVRIDNLWRVFKRKNNDQSNQTWTFK